MPCLLSCQQGRLLVGRWSPRLPIPARAAARRWAHRYDVQQRGGGTSFATLAARATRCARAAHFVRRRASPLRCVLDPTPSAGPRPPPVIARLLMCTRGAPAPPNMGIVLWV